MKPQAPFVGARTRRERINVMHADDGENARNATDSDAKFPFDDRFWRSEFFKNFRKEVIKNKKLLSIAREVKTFCSKFPVP